MLIYKTNFDENRHINFLIKEQKVFIKHMENLQKVSNNIKKKLNSEFIHIKKYLKAEKKNNKQTKKEAFNIYIHQQY